MSPSATREEAVPSDGPPLGAAQGGRGPYSAEVPALVVVGPASHVYSAARAEAADVPAPLFTLRGSVRLLGIDVYAPGRRGGVRLHVTTLVGESRELAAARIPIGPRVEADEAPCPVESGAVLAGPGTVWALEPVPGAHLWCAWYWPCSPGAALEGVE